MLKSILQPPQNNNRNILTNELTQERTVKLVNLLGYVLLTFMAIDYVALLFPPQLLNPTWELNTIGKIIETVFVTLLGFMLIFFRPEKQAIQQGELRILTWLSWLSLILGIICFLFAPLMINNALRINNTNRTNLSVQLTNQRDRVEQVELQLDGLNDTQLENLWRRNNRDSAPNSGTSTTEKKAQLSAQLTSSEQANRQQLQQRLRNRQRSLLKMTFKWVLGTIVAGVTFVSLWKYTDWARAFFQETKQRF